MERIERQKFKINKVFSRTITELTLIVNSVKMTFYKFPYEVPAIIPFDDTIKIPALIDLAAMKAYALGGRGKWKNYVDLYLLLTQHFTLDEICNRTYEIFGNAFNSRLLREQLAYFDDIDYDEEVSWVTDPVDPDKIKKELIRIATSL